MLLKRLVLLIVAVLALASMGESDFLVQAKVNKGKVRHSTRPIQVKKAYKAPEWITNSCLFVDVWFDWYGYHEIPQTIRYSIVLFFMMAPFYACFFFYCCVHNDEYDDETEEKEFKERVEKRFKRKLHRLATAKQMKFE